MKLTLPPALLVALLRIRVQRSPKAAMKRVFIFAAIPAIVMLLLNRPAMKDSFFCAVIVAFAVGLPYLTLLTIREERRARVQMPQFPPSPAPPVQRTLLSSTGRRLLPPSGIRQDEAAPAQAASELPEFLDVSPEEFALYFDAYEKRRAALLRLKPGEPVPPLNSKAGRRNQL
jgi:hypothetical protein